MASDLWTLKYRPVTFADVAGQGVNMAVLQQMVRTDRVPSGLIFSGVRGAGKTSTARILGAALNCEQAPDGPCGQCLSCQGVRDGQSLDVLEIDGASNGNVEAIRGLREQLLYSTGGAYRVVLLDECQSLSREAFNALLKTLEEPPDRTVFVLLTTEPGKIPDTIISRCMTFEYRKIAHADIVRRLEYICQAEDYPVEYSMLDFIAERSGGGLRDAVMALDQAHRVGITTLEAFREMVGSYDFAPALLAAMTAGNLPAVFAQTETQLSRIGDSGEITSDLVRCLADVLVIKAGGLPAASGTGLAVRQRLAGLLAHERLVASCSLLWDLKTKIRPGEDPRAILDLAVVLLTEVLSGGHKTAGSAKPAPARMSLADLKAAVGVSSGGSGNGTAADLPT